MMCITVKKIIENKQEVDTGLETSALVLAIGSLAVAGALIVYNGVRSGIELFSDGHKKEQPTKISPKGTSSTENLKNFASIHKLKFLKR